MTDYYAEERRAVARLLAALAAAGVTECDRDESSEGRVWVNVPQGDDESPWLALVDTREDEPGWYCYTQDTRYRAEYYDFPAVPDDESAVAWVLGLLSGKMRPDTPETNGETR